MIFNRKIQRSKIKAVVFYLLISMRAKSSSFAFCFAKSLAIFKNAAVSNLALCVMGRKEAM